MLTILSRLIHLNSELAFSECSCTPTDRAVEIFDIYAETFTDAAMGKAIANKLYQHGSDIIYHCAGGLEDGIIEAAKEQDKWVIGVDTDKSRLSPENVLTSTIKKFDEAAFIIIQDLINGNFYGGENLEVGLAEGCVDIAPASSSHVPENILDEVNLLKREIIRGSIVIPINQDQYDEYLRNL